MDDEFAVQCPYCGEHANIYVEPDVQGTLVQDCEVCCNPWRVDVWWEDGERHVNVTRGDGRVSEILCVGHSMRSRYASQSETREAER